MQEATEGSKLKGEITLVISAWKPDSNYEEIIGQRFNPNRDAKVNINILNIAEKLNDQVEMGEGEFRELMKTTFSEIPSYHINAIVRIVRQGKKRKRVDILADRVGGIF